MKYNKLVIGMLICSFISGCVTPPDYQSSVVLQPEAHAILYALETDLEGCEYLNAEIIGGARGKKIEPTVELAMIDSRNKSVSFGANRLLYKDTNYLNHFGEVYIGIQSSLYKCKGREINATSHITSQSTIVAKNKASKAASDAAMAAAQHQAQMAAQQAAQQAAMNSAIQNAQKVYNQNF